MAIGRDLRREVYRKVDTLVFRPSVDLGAVALEHARSVRIRSTSSGILSWLSRLGDQAESDFLSFVMFDGQFARRLIEIGRSDVLRRSKEVERFFGHGPEGPTAQPSPSEQP